MRTPDKIMRLTAVLCLTLCAVTLTACTAGESTGSEPTPTPQTEDYIAVSEGDFSFQEPILALDADGQPMLIVPFDYTNTTLEEKNASIIWMDHIRAYQGDQRLETALPPKEFTYSHLTDRINDNILPEKSLTAAFCYELIDNTTPVDLKIDKEIYGDEEMTKTFNLAGLPQQEKPAPTPTPMPEPTPTTEEAPPAGEANPAPKAQAENLTPQPVSEPSAKPSPKTPNSIV